MEEFFGKCFFMLCGLILLIKWAGQKFAENNPEATAEVKKKAETKAIDAINRFLK